MSKENKEVKKDPFKTQVASYTFWDWNKDEKFTGKYVDTVVLGDLEKKDSDGKPSAFTAHIFTNVETGELMYVSDSYAISETLKKVAADGSNLTDYIYQFTFIEKTEVKGKPFNKFSTATCTIQQYEEYISEK